jgi:hypothetical protein
VPWTCLKRSTGLEVAEVNVRGLRELERLFAAAGPEANRRLRKEMRLVAEPIRSDAEQLAASGITRIGPKWSRMRVGVTRTLVYVAPREKGVRTRGPDPRRRPKFADRMEEVAMGPALKRNEAQIEHRVGALFDTIANDWNRR